MKPCLGAVLACAICAGLASPAGLCAGEPHSTPGTSGAAAEIEALVKQLGAPRFDEREAATRRLGCVLLAHRPKLHALLMKGAEDREILARLQAIARELDEDMQSLWVVEERWRHGKLYAELTPQLQVRMARELEAAGKLRHAADACVRLARVYSESEEAERALLDAARLFLLAGKLDESRMWLAELKRRYANPTDPDRVSKLEKDIERLLPADLKALPPRLPDGPDAAFVIVGGRKLTPAEVAYYRKLTDLNAQTKVEPRNAAPYYEMGALFQAGGNFSLAKDLYYKAIDLDPKLAGALRNCGIILYREGKLGSALEYLTKAERLEPKNADIKYRRGLAHEGEGRMEQALNCYVDAIALSGECLDARQARARLLLRLRLFNEAEQAFRDAVAAEREKGSAGFAAATFNLALFLLERGRAEQALEALAPIESVPAAHADAVLLKARILAGLGRGAEALKLLEAWVQEDAENLDASDWLARLRAGM